MSATTDSQSKPQRLTIEDPVSRETLEHFKQLQDARSRIAERLLMLEQEKVPILVAAKKVDDQRQRLFEAVLIERGLPPQTEIEISAATGMITVLGASLICESS